MVTALELVIGALAEKLSVPVASKIPVSGVSDVFVRVEESAPQAFSPSHDAVVIIVQVFGRTGQLEKVLDIVGACRDFLRFELSTVAPNLVGWEEISGPVEFPDPDLADTHTRWQLSGQVFHTLA